VGSGLDNRSTRPPPRRGRDKRHRRAQPCAYLVNNGIANVSSLHAGETRAGIIVGVIDSGIRPGFPHISLDGSVVGCEDFVGDASAARTSPTTDTAPSSPG